MPIWHPQAGEFVATVDFGGDGRPYVDLFAAYRRRTEGAFANVQHPDEVGVLLVDVLKQERPAFRVGRRRSRGSSPG